jgi:hypothetical protein
MPDSDRRNSLLITDNKTGESCFFSCESGTISNFDFRQIKNPDDDARVSVIDEEKLLQQQLDRFSGALLAELLAGGPVVVDGLGIFSVSHEHAARETTDAGSRFLPPRKRVIFDPMQACKGESARVAVDRLAMGIDEASRLAKSLAGLFERSRKQSLDINLRGVGTFSTVDGRYGFKPEPSLVEVLNSAYDGLKTIDIPETQGSPSSASVAKKGGNGKKGVAVVMAIVLLAGGYFLFRQLSPDSIMPLNAVKATAPINPAPALVPVPSAPVRKAGSAEPDSVMLVKGRFTVVTATFSSLKTVRQEMQRLSGLGHRIRIWPVIGDGKQYYRLVVGDFESHRTALDSIKTMPPGLSKNIYIQQAPKNVVLYGENGL